MLRPHTSVPHGLEHFSIYFAVGLLFSLGFRWRLSLLAVTFVAFAAFVEMAQIAVPGRHARVRDFVVDAVALCVPLLVLPALKRARPDAAERE